jgi:hypothetical protein
MKIEEGNASKTNRLDKQFSIGIILALMIFVISGSTATHVFAVTRPTAAVQLPVYESEIFQERSRS